MTTADRPIAPAEPMDEDLALRARKAKEILTTLANTVSAMKIFPSEHNTVRTFVDSLAARLGDFFELSPRFEILVAEHSFLYEDRVVYTDETPSKSLPFFFFKDGTQALYFYGGLERPELEEFLDLVRATSLKPAEESDIVAALWESDFPHIQYYAPDDFLENQILAERRQAGAASALPGQASETAPDILEVPVDRAQHASGHIALRPQDRERLARAVEGPEPSAAPSAGDMAGPAEPSDSAGVRPEESSLPAGLSTADMEEINALVRSNRLIWPEEEFVNLTSEIVYLEEDPAICGASLDILRDFFLDQVRAGQFPAASLVLEKLRELQGYIAREAPAKALLVGETLTRLAGPRTLAAIDTALNTAPSVAWPAVLSFFRLLGPPVLPAAAGLFEKLTDLDVRKEVLAFIRDCGREDPALVTRLAGDVRPSLSLEIIRLLADLPDEKGIPPMVAFLDFKSRDIKLEAIRALGRRPHEKAGPILLGFLDDPDEVIRIQAALHLSQVGERDRIVHMIDQASKAAFRKKSFKEKVAILSFLGRTGSPEALAFLATVMKRWTVWPSGRNLEMRLAAVAGLAGMGTAEAKEALEAGLRARGKKVRQACGEALARLEASTAGRA